MLSDLNKPQKVFMVILYILTVISALVSSFVIYNLANVKKPWTLGVTYADALTTTEGQKQIISVKVSDNDNNNGIPVYDMRINSYADTEGNGLRGFGIQCVGNWKVVNKSDYSVFSTSIKDIDVAKDIKQMYINKEEIEALKSQYANMFEVNQTIAFGDFYFYYTGDDGKIYSKTSIENFDDELLIDIEGAYYKLSLKPYNYEVLSSNAWDLLIGNMSETQTSAYTWFEIFDLVMTSAINTNAETKYSEFPLSLMDLSDFVTLQYQDKDLPKTTENRNYFTIQVDYSNNGAVKSEDSMFGMIYASPKYDYYAETSVNDYWNAYSELIITEDNVNFVYSEVYDSYCVVIDSNFSDYLKTLIDSEIKVNLDLTNLEFNVYGIDLQNFNFDIENFEIKVNSIEDFKIYNQDLCSVEPTLSEV